jgi:hypothetical protein
MNSKNYTDWQIIEYKKRKYIFNPYLFGRGAWAILTANNKPGKYVEKSLQRELNQFYFQRDELPTMQERFRNASAEEREKLRDISISWLQLKIKGIQQGIGVPQTLTPEYKQFVEGGLYLYVYDAKYKDILPIWDKFPLTIVLEKYNEGFLGLNLHYLDTNIRLGLLGQLIERYGTDNRETNMKRLYLQYENIKKSTPFKPCIKRYLSSHVQSKILPIQAHEWVFAAIVSIPQFQKQKSKKK